MTEIISNLISLGLTGNEASLYIALSSHGDMTGYECAKITGISRSNAYIALAGLCDKGGAYLIDGTAQKYSPAPIKEFCANKRRVFESAVSYLLENMPLPVALSEAYITISGTTAILDKMKNLIDACTERLYISAETATLEKIVPELNNAIYRKRKVVLMADHNFNLDGAIKYNMTRKEGQIRLIVDSLFVLTGDFMENRPCSCLFSASATLVSLFKESMKNEILLIELGEKDKNGTVK
jgi:sugar-specific transcriptional regulator TrmB